MKKHIANIITSTRIIGGIFLFFVNDFTLTFYIVYTLCGFTDLIDGKIARKLGTTSNLGSNLDTIGDVLMYLALARLFAVQKLVPLYVLIWMGITGLGYLSSGFIAKEKLNKFVIIHTFFGKALGVFVFVMPYMKWILEKLLSSYMDKPYMIWEWAICLVSTIGAIQTIAVQVLGKADKYLAEDDDEDDENPKKLKSA